MAEPSSRGQDDVLLIIPARFASTRFPGKPLFRLSGPGGSKRTLIEWSWRAARRVTGVERVIVATDDHRIAAEVERFGGSAVMTPQECANGTERCAAVVASMTKPAQIVVNFQGDAPLTPPHIVEAVIGRMHSNRALAMVTPAIPCTGDTLRHLIADRAADRVGGTTVVFNRAGRALYFSKNIVPFVPSSSRDLSGSVHLHLGIYAYSRDALLNYRAAPPSALEDLEGLEQLRFLDMGLEVSVVICEPPLGPMIELNNPSDVDLIEGELMKDVL